MINIEDIYDIIEKPAAKSSKFLLIILMMFFVLGIGFFIFYKYLKNKKSSPEQIFFKEVKSLDIEKYFQEKKFDIFYEKLSQIIKKYFSRKTGNDCSSLSDIEFCQYLSDNEDDINKKYFFDKKKLELLRTAISNFQKVKFARQEAVKQQMLDDVSIIFSIVKID